jgi:hypothetical protein
MNYRKLAKPRKRSRWHCRKCGINTYRNDEYYMVHDKLWQIVIHRWKIPTDECGEAGMLCIGCFESLLGRKLTRRDFTDCPLNMAPLADGSFQSDRLYDRLSGKAP